MAKKDQGGSSGLSGALFVRTSDEDLIRWNRQRIVNALLRETDVSAEVAVEISREIQEIIAGADLRHISTALIRELVDIKLIERGLEQQQERHCRLGLPVYDAEHLITRCGMTAAHGLLGPEATNRALAETIKKDYALLSLFSERVADAHRCGDLHLENLGQVDRPHACLLSPEYIKKHGLSLPGTLSNARPARRPEVLLSHLARFSAFLQGHFSSTIAWDMVNVFVAPFLSGAGPDEVKQLAQFLIYEFSQLSAARDHQPIFCDLHLYYGVPRSLRSVPALGPDGRETGRSYGDYQTEARGFSRALLEVLREGDGDGGPFFHPQLVLHLDGGSFRAAGGGRFLSLAAETAVRNGNPFFLFDRGSGAVLTELGPREMMFRPAAGDERQRPWNWRLQTLQSISINLPRLAFRCGGNDAKLFDLVRERLDLCAAAHKEKRIFLEKLLAYGRGGPLALLMMRRDDAPLLELERTCHLIGLCGLNELALAHTGHEIHRSRKSARFAQDLVRRIAALCEDLSVRHRMRFLPAESHSSVAAQRFARKDLRFHSPHSGHVVRGDISGGAVHYTHGARLSAVAGSALSRRVSMEGESHPFLTGGAFCDILIGDSAPAAADAARFIRRVFGDTLTSLMAFSPRFRYCTDCHRGVHGEQASCPGCGGPASEAVARDGIYYTKPGPGDIAVPREQRSPRLYGPEDFREKR